MNKDELTKKLEKINKDINRNLIKFINNELEFKDTENIESIKSDLVDLDIDEIKQIEYKNLLNENNLEDFICEVIDYLEDIKDELEYDEYRPDKKQEYIEYIDEYINKLNGENIKEYNSVIEVISLGKKELYDNLGIKINGLNDVEMQKMLLLYPNNNDLFDFIYKYIQ